MLNNPTEYALMAAAEQQHWWYKALHWQCLQVIKKLEPATNATVVDVGCGTGGLLTKLKHAGYANLLGIDASAIAVGYTQKLGHTVIQAEAHSLPIADNSVDYIFCNDVFCYYPTNQWPTVLQHLHSKLKPSGYFIGNTPVGAIYQGQHDKAVGIVCRPTAQFVKQQLHTAGFAIQQKRQWPFLLSPIIAGVRTVQRWQGNVSNPTSDVKQVNPLINNLLWGITKLELEVGLGFGGSSVFWVVRKGK